jgi:hypothetical protein
MNVDISGVSVESATLMIALFEQQRKFRKTRNN